MPSLIEQLRSLSGQLEARAKPVSYLVLDPALPMQLMADDVDGRGHRYIVCSPAVLDEMQHRKWERPTPFDGRAGDFLFGISVYRRQDMSADWPRFEGRQAA